MKLSALSPFVCFVVLTLPFAALAMNNNDVVKMHKAGLSDDTILAAIDKEPAEYDTGTDALIELKAAGISEKLIQRMIARKGSGSAPSASAAAPAGVAGTGAFYQDFPAIAPAKAEIAIGKDYFTRFSFHEEKNEHSTTNYARGALVPINTPVKVISMAGSKMVLKRLDTAQEIKVDNEEKYTKKPIAAIASMMLSAEKTPLEKLPTEVANAIRGGEMRKGMTKELVLMARGFPPAHETPSTEGDRWVYWSSRFVKQTIVFVDGRLSEGRGLY